MKIINNEIKTASKTIRLKIRTANDETYFETFCSYRVMTFVNHFTNM